MEYFLSHSTLERAASLLVLRRTLTIPDCAAAWLGARCEDVFDECCWRLDAGMLDAWHDIDVLHHMVCGLSLSHDRKPNAVRANVRNSLKNSERGRKLFDCREVLSLYPGIVNGWSNVFVLKEDFRFWY